MDIYEEIQLETFDAYLMSKPQGPWIDTPVHIVEGYMSPIITHSLSGIESIITVGEDWFTEEQLAELMAMRLKGELIIVRECDKVLLCKSATGGTLFGNQTNFGGFVAADYAKQFKNFADCGVKAKDAMDALAGASNILVGKTNA